MKKLIPDNIPELLKLDVRVCKDDAEFYTLLRQYIVQNVNKVFDEKDRKKKENALDDSLSALQLLESKLGIADKERLERLDYTGGFGQRYYMEFQDKKASSSDVQKVEKFGEDNDWPAMILRRHNGKVTKFVGKGKDMWQEVIATYSLKEPYNENFLDLLRAVEENDIYGDYQE